MVVPTPYDEERAMAMPPATSGQRVRSREEPEIERLIDALMRPGCYPHAVERVEVLQTHISYVLLAGDYAYKIKKPVNLGFLDFSTLEARRRCCDEELRLNRRTAPDLYLATLPITGSASSPALDGEGPAIEYAVKMRRFAQDALLDSMARRGELAAPLVDAIARKLAVFHAAVAVAGPGTRFGTPDQVVAPARANFEHIERLIGDSPDVAQLERLRSWSEREGARLAPSFAARKRGGFVRECHGDLHLGNIALIDGEPTPFDCIEFSADLRWIDVMNEVAFLVMDLADHRLAGLAIRCLNAYLEATGDYAGLAVLRFYLVYRAMVRAKVACIRAHQSGLTGSAKAAAEDEYRGYFRLAEDLMRTSKTALILTHGLSASGKTTVAGILAERLGAIRLRSDVERKRLFGLDAAARTASAVGAGIYAPDATRRTYDRLTDLTRVVLEAGRPVIVDATFLRDAERAAFRSLGKDLGVPVAFVSCTAPDAELRARIVAREQAGSDASEAGLAVLAQQRNAAEPASREEARETVVIDTSLPRERWDLPLKELAERLGIRTWTPGK
jgi:aminoglycoside phosphotransferase family enzyme/predicted kinase